MNTIQMINLFNATKDSNASTAEVLIAVAIGLVLGAVILGILEWLLNR